MKKGVEREGGGRMEGRREGGRMRKVGIRELEGKKVGGGRMEEERGRRGGRRVKVGL